MRIRFTFGLLLLAIDYGSTECPPPEIPENGRLVEVSQNTTNSISYQCDPGFILVGNDKRSCLQGGTWSGTTPVCALNVALHKPAIQSSTRFDDPTLLYHANYSTDGNFDGTCSATVREKIAWWQVDLLETHKIYAVELMIPQSSDQENSDTNVGQKIHILTSLTDDFSGKSRSLSLCYKHEGSLEKNRLHTFICIKESSARYVRVVVRNAAVHMCEVVVLSTAVASDWQCPNAKDMQLWGTFNGVCYYGSYDTAPWFSAKNRCEELSPGSSLVTDFNANLQTFLVSQLRSRVLKPAQFYWLGLSNVNNDWQWVNGRSVNVHFWADPGARNVAMSTLQYGVTVTEPFNWNWMPSLQAVWYNWICQSRLKFCTSPNVPLNGGLMTTGQMRTVGASIFYYCNKGYMINGDKSRTCQDNGVWSNAAPTCIAVDCGRPKGDTNLKIKYINDSTSLGSIIEYECPPSQRLLGSQSRICQADGFWSDNSPRCNDVDCGWPEKIEHGKVALIQNSTVVGTIAEYACDGGFVLNGASVRHCTSSGLWTPPTAPICADLNGVQSALGAGNLGSHQTSLITGFIIAIVILLIVLFLVVFYIWRRKKMYDTFSMSTLGLYSGGMISGGSQTNISSTGTAGCGQDVLYAFPSTVTTGVSTTAASLKDSTHYYPPSISSLPSELGGGHDTTPPPGYLQINLESLHTSSNLLFRNPSKADKEDNSTTQQPAVDSSKIHVDSIKKREIERILKEIQLTMPTPRRGAAVPLQRAPLSASQLHQQVKNLASKSTWKNSNIVEFFRQKFNTVDNRCSTQQPRPKVSIIETNQIVRVSDGEQQRSRSPTLSELFSFDDDDTEEKSITNNDDIDLQGRRVCEEIYSMVGELRRNDAANNSNNNNNHRLTINNENSKGEKIYDVPPDASTFLSNSSLARALIKHLKTSERETIYDTPRCVQQDSEDFDDDSNVPNESAIETVHTYC